MTLKDIIKKLLKPDPEQKIKGSHKITTGNPNDSDLSLLKKIKELDPWFYPIVIKNIQIIPGIGSNQPAQRLNDRTLYREQLIVDEVVRNYDLKDKSILDIACNLGYWSSRYVMHGARSVIGIEGRELFLKQAELYWANTESLAKTDYKFIKGNVLDEKLWEKIQEMRLYDITLCTGILYHLPDYRKLLKWISNITRDLIIIDTRVSNLPEKIFSERGDLYFNAIKETRNKIVPNLTDLMAHIRTLGFEPEVIKPRYIEPTSMPECDSYTRGNRVTIHARRINN